MVGTLAHSEEYNFTENVFYKEEGLLGGGVNSESLTEGSVLLHYVSG